MDQKKLSKTHAEAVEALEGSRELIEKLRSRGWSLRVGQRGQLVPGQVAALAASLASPSDFWARAAVGTLEGLGVEDGAALISSSIKLTAAQLKGGNLDPIREALVGQATWLGALAVRLEGLAAEVQNEHGGAQEREGLIKLALRAAEGSSKAMASAAALNAIRGGADVTVG